MIYTTTRQEQWETNVGNWFLTNMAAEEGESREEDVTKDSKRADAPLKLRYKPASSKLNLHVPSVEIVFVVFKLFVSCTFDFQSTTKQNIADRSGSAGPKHTDIISNLGTLLEKKELFYLFVVNIVYYKLIYPHMWAYFQPQTV